MKSAKSSEDYLKCLNIEANKQKELKKKKQMRHLNNYKMVHPDGSEIEIVDPQFTNPRFKITHISMKNNESFTPQQHHLLKQKKSNIPR